MEVDNVIHGKFFVNLVYQIERNRLSGCRGDNRVLKSAVCFGIRVTLTASMEVDNHGELFVNQVNYLYLPYLFFIYEITCHLFIIYT